MRSLSDTITRLAAFKARTATWPAAPSAQAGRLANLASFGSNPGALQAWFYKPADLPAGAPLVVVLHGCTQDAQAYDRHSGWSQLADEAGFAVLYPEQQRSNNPNLCFNWFQPADVRRDSGEVQSIRQMIDGVVEAHGLDRKRIFVTGLSAGGAMACAMLASYPEVFAGGAVVAGLAFASAATVPEAFDRMRGHGAPDQASAQRLLRDAAAHRGPWPRISIWHGSEDRTVEASNADAIASQWWGVHQVDRAPSHSVRNGRHTRTQWWDQEGRPVLEVNMIDGMGHGTPVDPDQLGTAGPYMLDVGISSTHEIARFFGIIVPQEAGANASNARAWVADQDGTDVKKPSETASARRPRSGAPGVKETIDEALRAAGLLR